MKKFVFILLLITVALVGCGTQDQMEEVTALIETGNYDEAINKIEEDQLTDTFNIDELESLKEMDSLFSESAYTRVLSQYKNNPITNEELQSTSDDLLIQSIEGSMENVQVLKLAIVIVDGFDSDTKARIEEGFEFEKIKQEVDSIAEMEELLEEGAYTRVLTQYRNQPITVEELQPTSDELIVQSLEGSSENAEVFKLANMIVEDFDNETQDRIKQDIDLEQVKQELDVDTEQE
ncbi:hypothetical protein [Aquibacillus sediminis]|uniref:hypothetical protein n=1 Tax=Aquibacillus sediminis TaxID=2574734 RepID=UPI001109B091|nr:hypothetical protein [Aquibacillus sediminis]